MKLTAKTRDNVRTGTVLIQDNGYTYTVTNVISVRNGTLITVRIPDGRQIYAMPLSTYYGLTIINN